MYSREERETILRYDAAKNSWDAYSCEPKHIRKLCAIAGEPYWKENAPGEVRIIAGRWKLSEKQVRMVQERQISEAQRTAISERMKSMHAQGVL